MFAKINHLAITTDNFAALSVFYRSLFGLHSDHSSKREHQAISVGDGYLGMNLNPRMPGRQAGFDHFGIEVESIDAVSERLKRRYPQVGLVKRPSNRPFASYSMHDPVGNYFDLSQQGMANRGEVYVDGARDQRRRFGHFALRAIEPRKLADFYIDVFELAPKNVPEDGGAIHLTDGRMTMVILPWNIADFLGSGIERPAPDHIGFEVESLAVLKKDLEIMCLNPMMQPKPLGHGPEGQVRLKLFEKTRLGQFYLSDPDGVLIAVNERPSAGPIDLTPTLRP
jgi:predicted enzyme related to lactoylglutathione lyase